MDGSLFGWHGSAHPTPPPKRCNGRNALDQKRSKSFTSWAMVLATQQMLQDKLVMWHGLDLNRGGQVTAGI
jgi:hypothetical protein